jgi:hypothetical protein
MGTTHGAEELGLCSHGLACQAGAWGRYIGFVIRVFPIIFLGGGRAHPPRRRRANIYIQSRIFKGYRYLFLYLLLLSMYVL